MRTKTFLAATFYMSETQSAVPPVAITSVHGVTKSVRLLLLGMTLKIRFFKIWQTNAYSEKVKNLSRCSMLFYQ